jgi:GT2 family glycosyltransferase
MHSSHIILSLIAWLIGVVWLYKLFEAARGLPTVPNLLEPEYDVAPAGNPSITVIVPARDEAANVAACLESLVDQDYDNLRVIGVDDRSTDQTGTIMDVLAGTHPDRLEVLHVTDLPANWLGKTHAMALAAQQAIATHTPDYLLFTDGDIVFRVDTIRRSLAHAVATQADHFVLLPTLTVKTRGEAMILSCLQVMSMWAVRLWRVADPRAKRDAVGVGAFNLIRTAVYRQLGGFDATPMEILEDLTLGRRVKHAGFRQRMAIAPGMVCVHWAAGVFGLLNGMTKNVFAVFRFRPVFLLAGAIGLALFCIAPVAFLALPATRIPALIGLVSVVGFYVLSSRITKISSYYAVLFPISAALLAYSMLRSMLITMFRGGVEWRGTFYKLSELRKHADHLFWQ